MPFSSLLRTASSAPSSVQSKPDRVLDSAPDTPDHRPVSSDVTSIGQTWRDLLLIFALSLPLFFWKLGGWALFDPDEGRYAEIPREMIAGGDWITPTLNHTKYFEKPPLFYWLVGGSFKLFGLSEWAARLVPALCALLGLFLTYALARRMFGRRTGTLSALVLATTLFWPIMARSLVIDMLLSVALFAASAFWWLGHTETTSRRGAYFLAFWFALALAFLSKGPVAVLLTGASIGIYLAVCRQWKAVRALQWTAGLLLFTVLVAPWFVLVALKNPEFNRYFWLEQNIFRFLGIGKNREHVEPFTYFFQFLPLLFFPWTFLVPAALSAGIRKIWLARSQTHTQTQRAIIYLLCNAAFVILFFSVSTGKLITYILPSFPPLAILMACYLDWTLRHRTEAWRRPLKIGSLLLSLLLGIAGIGAVVLASSTRTSGSLAKIEARMTALGLSQAMIAGVGIVLLLWAMAIAVSTLKRHERALVASLSSGFIVFFLSVVSLLCVVAPNFTVKPLLAYIRPGLNRGATFVMYRSYMQGASFYTRKRLVNIGSEGELKFGISRLSSQERAIWFPKEIGALQEMLDQPQPVYCLVNNHRTAQELLSQLRGKAVEIVWNSKRSVIGNAAAARLTPPKK